MSFFSRLSGGVAEEEPEEPPLGQSLMDRARGAMGLQPTRRDEMVDSMCPQWTAKQRLYGFGICFGIGCLISLGSMFFFRKLLAGHPTGFAVNYTVGNIVSLASTGFLIGPARQLKRAMSPTRIGAFITYVSAIVATIFCSLVLPHIAPHMSVASIAGLVIVCIIIQFVAMFWYCLSYIPFGRRMCKACCVSAMSDG